jgi:hypothetical protein
VQHELLILHDALLNSMPFCSVELLEQSNMEEDDNTASKTSRDDNSDLPDEVPSRDQLKRNR